MKITAALAAWLCVAALARPAAAQAPTDVPSVSLRPFFLAAGERFTARQTFEAVFGRAVQPLWGGGLEVAFRRGFYVGITASRFSRTGERAFFFDGEGFGLGIPLTATLTPLELTAGGRVWVTPRVIPYAGAGIGLYRYEETSPFDEPFAARHAGYHAVGGIELRVSRWVGIGGDVQYTYVSGIIGAGGISQEAGERDLGGIAARFRVIVGR